MRVLTCRLVFKALYTLTYFPISSSSTSIHSSSTPATPDSTTNFHIPKPFLILRALSSGPRPLDTIAWMSRSKSPTQLLINVLFSFLTFSQFSSFLSDSSSSFPNSFSSSNLMYMSDLQALVHDPLPFWISTLSLDSLIHSGGISSYLHMLMILFFLSPGQISLLSSRLIPSCLVDTSTWMFYHNLNSTCSRSSSPNWLFLQYLPLGNRLLTACS